MAVGLVYAEEVALASDQLDVESLGEAAVRVGVICFELFNEAVTDGPAVVLAVRAVQQAVCRFVPVGVLDVQVAGDGTTAAALADLASGVEELLHDRDCAVGFPATADCAASRADRTEVGGSTEAVLREQGSAAKVGVVAVNAVTDNLAGTTDPHPALGAGVAQRRAGGG